MIEAFRSIVTRIPFYVYGLVFLFLAKIFYQVSSKLSFHDELTERDNPAFGAGLAGYLIGLAIALTGAFPDGSGSILDAAITMTYSGLAAVLLMRLSIWINHRIILRHFNIQVEMIRDKNTGAGFVAGGASIGTGLVLAAALTGQSEGYFNAVRDILVYWLVGQLLFMGGAIVYCRTASYNVQKTLEDDNNTAVGLGLGGFLIALGILLWAALQNASSDVIDELGIVFAFLVVTAPLLFLTTALTERLIFPKVNLAKEIVIDKNTAAGLVCAAASICTAILLAATVIAN